MKNTKKIGRLRYMIYFDAPEQEFVGVCIDLGIIKTGENPYVVEQDLVEAAMGYVEAVGKKSFSDGLLNQRPPQMYLDIYNEILRISSESNCDDSIAHSGINLDRARTLVQEIPAHA